MSLDQRFSFGQFFCPLRLVQTCVKRSRVGQSWTQRKSQPVRELSILLRFTQSSERTFTKYAVEQWKFFFTRKELPKSEHWSKDKRRNEFNDEQEK